MQSRVGNKIQKYCETEPRKNRRFNRFNKFIRIT